MSNPEEIERKLSAVKQKQSSWNGFIAKSYEEIGVLLQVYSY